MSEPLQNLMFTIDLLDQVTGPAGKICNSIEGVTDTFSKVAGGAAGVAAAGYAISALAAPAQEFNNVIGEVRSLGVAQDSLDMLADKSIAFSIKYGESAQDFVSSSYDIQSAIAGLSGEELTSFTNASNILAKGTKADAATITDYMGTMYGIFADDANAMGKADWVEQLTGQTATAVQMFKTTGSEMASGFSALGSSAAAMGVPMTEQLAVLGTLQATMAGSEAATKYTAFISGAVKAQDELGLSLFNAAGKMKPMTEVLGLINSKVGQLGADEQYDVLSTAFGGGEAVKLIQNLMPKVEQLGGSIADLGNITGMEKAMTMADSMVDPFARWSQGTMALRIGLGQALLPVLIPVVEGMAEGAGTMYRWSQEYPTLTKYIGYAVIGVTGLTGAVAAFSVIGGVASMAVTGYGAAVGLASGVMTAFNVLTSASSIVFAGLNFVMGLNPALLVAGGITLLVGAVAGAIYYWDDLKAAFLDTTWGQNIMGWIHTILGGFQSLTGAWDWMKDKMSWFGGEDHPVVDVVTTQENLTSVPGAVDGPVAEALKPQAALPPMPGVMDGPVAEVLKPQAALPPMPGVMDGPVAQALTPQAALPPVPSVVDGPVAEVLKPQAALPPMPGVVDGPVAEALKPQVALPPMPGVVDGPVAEVLKPQVAIPPMPGVMDGPVAEALKPHTTLPSMPGAMDGPLAEALKPLENLSSMPALTKDHMAGVPRTSPLLEAPRRMVVPAGGVSHSIATAITNKSESSSQTFHIGQITTSRPINAQEITNMLVMGA